MLKFIYIIRMLWVKLLVMFMIFVIVKLEKTTRSFHVLHIFFKFDLFFLLKNIRLSVWRTKDINIGGKNLTDINFASIDNFKFIDAMKYYQTSLGQLSETLPDEEIQNIAELTVQFIINHDYFSIVWKNLTVAQKNKIKLLSVEKV